jgi:LSD1 subclass zinc finger protein
MENQTINTNTTQNEIVCKGCSAKLTYAPGTNSLKCEHCGALNEIILTSEVIEELDYEKYLSNISEEAHQQDVTTVKCDACSAQTSFEANVVSGNCPFCGNPIVLSSGTIHRSIQPKSLLPFAIDKKKAMETYSLWLKKLWWAPNDLLQLASQEGKLVGMYIPYWTYDANTSTSYTGERGEEFTETEEYETTENDETVVRTRTVVRTVWFPVSGAIETGFDDTLVIASKSLPVDNTEKLEPWDLQNLVPFNPSFLSGYKTESYQIDLKEGFEVAKSKMEEVIRENVLRDIGGVQQRIHFMNTVYNGITFKHILLPLWISAYRYQNKVYRFLINGRTGEVQGERPYSWVKITLAIVAGIAIIALIAMFA